MIKDKFKVVSISTNANSFGLKGVMIVSKSGLAFEVAVGSIYVQKQGDVWNVLLTDKRNISKIEGINYELPRSVPAPSQDVIDAIWKSKATAFTPELKSLVSGNIISSIVSLKNIRQHETSENEIELIDVIITKLEDITTILSSGLENYADKVVIDKMADYLANDLEELPAILKTLKEARNGINSNDLVDYLHDVNVIESHEFNFTINQFCELIGLK